MLENANALKEQFLEKVNSAASSNELEQLRIEFLGKKGPITSLMSELRNIPNEQKKEAGQIINEVKQFIEKTLAEKNEEIKKAELDGSAVWQVYCHRVTMGKTPDKHVYLDYMTLGFVKYMER